MALVHQTIPCLILYKPRGPFQTPRQRQEDSELADNAQPSGVPACSRWKCQPPCLLRRSFPVDDKGICATLLEVGIPVSSYLCVCGKVAPSTPSFSPSSEQVLRHLFGTWDALQSQRGALRLAAAFTAADSTVLQQWIELQLPQDQGTKASPLGDRGKLQEKHCTKLKGRAGEKKQPMRRG